MTQERKAVASATRRRPAGSLVPGEARFALAGTYRVLSARSIVGSILLGVRPPRLPARVLVGAGELLGVSEGAIRTAVSRMTSTGELVAHDDAYELAGHLLARQARQDESRQGTPRRQWDGRWAMAVVGGGERQPARERTARRDALGRLRYAELREGVWLRPDNLDPTRLPEVQARLAGACRFFAATPDDDPTALAASLWDLDGWASTARVLRADVRTLRGPLEAGDDAALGPSFVVSAAVLRHTQADPLLPTELLPDDWPGDDLRADYERFDAAFKRLWRTHLRAAT